jgi:hypothetical protein
MRSSLARGTIGVVIVAAGVNVAAWRWDTMTVDVPISGFSSGLALDSTGNPHLAYCRLLTDGLVYARWDPVDSVWIYEAVLDSVKGGDKNAGREASIALDPDGYPYISFDWGDLAVTWKDSLGWNVARPCSGYGVQGTSIALDENGFPHVGHEAPLPDTTTLVLHTYWDGNDWITETIDTVAVAGAHWATLCIDSWDTVHMAYGELGDYFHRLPGIGYAKKVGTEWVREYVDTADFTCYFSTTSLIAVNSLGYPCIAYEARKPTGEIRYAEKTDSGWCITRVDTPWVEWSNCNSCGGFVIDKDDNPHIAYFNHPHEAYDSPYSLKYAWRHDGKWYYDVIDTLAGMNGPPASPFAGIAIDGNGYSHISYAGEATVSSCKMKYARGRADTIGVQAPARYTPSFLEVYPTIARRKIRIRYAVPEETRISLGIYDIAGRKAGELPGGQRCAGEHTEYWEANEISSGIFFCVCTTGKEQLAKKFIVMK